MITLFAYYTLAEITPQSGPQRPASGLTVNRRVIYAIVYYAFHPGEDASVIRIIEIVISAGFGAFGGYGLANAKNKSKERPEDQ